MSVVFVLFASSKFRIHVVLIKMTKYLKCLFIVIDIFCYTFLVNKFEKILPVFVTRRH